MNEIGSDASPFRLETFLKNTTDISGVGSKLKVGGLNPKKYFTSEL
jgi:hypothetical protein